MQGRPVFRTREIATLGFVSLPAIDDMFALSPFVWREADRYRILLRMVNRAEDPQNKISQVFAGVSTDGVAFRLDDLPAIAPDPDGDDRDGCEDPTAVHDGNELSVFYSGWNEKHQRGNLLRAAGARTDSLQKCGLVIASSDRHRNPKEASLAQCASGDWVLFFEYAADNASKIGLARSPDLAGPWVIDPEFDFASRPASWDSWHLSPGPIVAMDPREPMMFYNGGTRESRWRVGWVVFDENFSRIIDRGEDPLIVPPPPSGDDADIAFIASACANDDETIDVYYSIADRFCKRATLERLHNGTS